MSKIICLFSKTVLFEDIRSPLEKHVDEVIERLKIRFPERSSVVEDNCFLIEGDTLHLDTYNHGDVHNSMHDPCYVNRDKKKWNSPIPFPSNPKVFSKLKNNNQIKNVVLGYQSDSFMWMDQKYGITKLALETFNDKPIEIFTRSDLVAHEDYIALMNKSLVKIYIYIPRHLDEEKARIEEPGAPSIKRRMQALEKLQKLGYDAEALYTYVSKRKRKSRKSAYRQAV